MPRGTEGVTRDQLIESGFATLRQSAYRSASEATWLGNATGGIADVGPSFYSGTAGIGWALANYARERDRSWAAELALAAGRHAISNAPRIPRSERLGFYGGWSGIVYAAHVIARILDESSLLDEVTPLVHALRDAPDSTEFDLMCGSAGATLGFSLLARDQDVVARALAAQAADHLRRMSRPQGSDERIAWVAPHQRRRLPLTGMAHGTAGAGLALLEFWNTTPDAVWARDLAERAFAYETWCFRPLEANWPDLRHYPSWRVTRLLPPPCEAAWCHGAGGIGLSRARAFELTGDSQARATAEGAARTLYRDVSNGLKSGSLSLDLCHGLAGAAQTLLVIGHRVQSPEIIGLGDELTTRLIGAIDHFVHASWGLEPGLMLGSAGIASFLLSRVGTLPVTALAPAPVRWSDV